MNDPRPTRRAFLRGEAAADALTGAIDAGALPPGAPEADPRAAQREACLLTLTRRAMACEFQVRLCADQQRNETAPALAALDLIDQLEDRLSVYRDHSEIMRLNREAQQNPAAVEADMFALLRQCDALWRATGGAFDATTGPLSRAWGFFERRGRVPSDEQLAEALARVGWRHISLDEELATLEIHTPGVEINFNGIGKGYALDCAVELLAREGVEDALIHGGRSTLAARGRKPSGETSGWRVGLRHPLRPQRRIAEFTLVNEAFSTSGSATQGFVDRGRRFGHILDPRTGRPAGGAHSVSVLAPSGTLADALSTAFYVMGPEAAERFCSENHRIGALFVLPGPTASSVSLHPVNLPQDRWRPLSAD